LTELAEPTGTPISRFVARRSGALTTVRATGWPGALLLVFVLLAIFGPLLAPKSPLALNELAVNLSPFSDAAFPLGTDNLGRDVLSRVLDGARLSLVIGIVPVLVSGLVGFGLGLLAGFGPRWLSFAILRVLDVAFAFPAIMLALAVAAMLGPSVRNAIIAMIIVLIPPVARVARAAALDVAGRPYIAAARLSGASWPRIVWDFAAPNMVAPVVVYCASLAGLMIIFGAGLSFIGVGVQPPTAEWGRMVADGRATFLINPGVSLIPGACIFVVSLAFNLVADRLRDHLDPRLKT
jgi:peptide/nickel transport system permease protein